MKSYGSYEKLMMFDVIVCAIDGFFGWKFVVFESMTFKNNIEIYKNHIYRLIIINCLVRSTIT